MHTASLAQWPNDCDVHQQSANDKIKKNLCANCVETYPKNGRKSAAAGPVGWDSACVKYSTESLAHSLTNRINIHNSEFRSIFFDFFCFVFRVNDFTGLRVAANTVFLTLFLVIASTVSICFDLIWFLFYSQVLSRSLFVARCQFSGSVT